MPKDRVQANRAYYEKHKAKWKKYRLDARKKAQRPYKKLSEKQKTFKRAVDHGVDPAEAVKRAYPDTTNISRKLTAFKQNPILAASIDNYVATMVEAGFTEEFEAEKLHTIASKTKKDSNPHADRNTIIVLQDWRKTRGLDVERSETRSLNININMTEEQMEFFQRKLEEKKKQKEEVIDID